MPSPLLPVPRSASRSPRATLSTLGTYVALNGPSRTRHVASLARPTGNPRDYYAPLRAAIRRDLTDGGGERHLRAALANWRSRAAHYAQVAEGWATWAETHPGLRPRPGHRATWFRGGTTVTVQPHLIWSQPAGAVQAVRMWCADQPPPANTVLATLALLTAAMHDLSPGGDAVLLDVRRTRAYTLIDGLPPTVEDWLVDEATSFAQDWRAAA